MTFFPAFRTLTVSDPVQGLSFPLLTFHPTHTPAARFALGPYALDLSPDAPPADGAQLVLDLVAGPKQVTFRLVPNAGHFSFLSPVPESMKSPFFPPGNDPEGFDREKFQQELCADVRAFFDGTLQRPASSN